MITGRFVFNDDIPRLTEYMMYLASVDANKLGFGYDFMKSNNAAWVISRFSIVFERPLKHGEGINIKTFPRGTDGLFYYRAFEIMESDCNEAANAESAWLIIDIDSRKPLRNSLESPQAGDDFTRPRRLNMFANAEQCTGIIDVNESHIDVNGHVNSINYIEWMFDCLETDSIVSMNINYKQECFKGDRLKLYRTEEAGKMLMTLKRVNDNSVVALGKIVF